MPYGTVFDYVLSSAYTAADVLAKLTTVDGASSNLDADLVDGQHASAFETAGAVTTHAAVTATHGATGAVVGTTNTQTVQNKTLDNTTTLTVKDANLTIQDDADATKQAKFQASGITAGQTRTYTLPDASTTLVGTDTTQTLAAKTLTTPTIGDLTNATHTHQNAAGGGQLDHGLALTGLTDDDHTQYLLAAGSRALSADWDIGSGRKISGDKIAARSASGLALVDDSDTYGIFVKDGGIVGIGTNNPILGKLWVTDSVNGGEALIQVHNSIATGSSIDEYAGIQFLHNESAAAKIIAGKEEDFSVASNRTGNLAAHVRKDGNYQLGWHLDSNRNFGVNTIPSISGTLGIDLNGDTLRIRTARTPASAAATGNAGEICWASGFIYVCTATNTWKRVAIATW